MDQLIFISFQLDPKWYCGFNVNWNLAMQSNSYPFHSSNSKYLFLQLIEQFATSFFLQQICDEFSERSEAD